MKRAVFFMEDVLVSETTDDAGYDRRTEKGSEADTGFGNEPEITVGTVVGYSPRSIYEKYWAALIGSQVEKIDRVMVR